MPNRIETAITRIEEKLKTVPEEKRRSLEEGLKTGLDELVEYQRLQSTAFACGKLGLEEANILYQLYGGEVPSPGKWDKLSLAKKIVGTSTAAELAKMRLCDIL